GKRSIVSAVAGVDLLLPAAVLLRTAAHGAVALGDLLGDEAGAAARAGFRHGPVPGDELTRRVAATTVEDLPAPRAPLHHLARATRESFDARRAGLVERLHVAALGVAGAAEELPVASEADLHREAALLALLVGGLRLHRADRPVVVAREVGGVLAIGVAATGEELAAASPFDDHRLAALLAHEIGETLLALHVEHPDLRLLEVARKRLPEAPHRQGPVLLPLLDAIELVLHAGGELDVQHVGERLDQQVGHQEAELGGLQAALVVLDHVLLVEDGPHDA